MVGHNGVSSEAFVDNASCGEYVYKTFNARVLDMESAVVACRSLSDLAGGDQGANEIRTFLQLASNNSATVVQRFLALWTPPR